MRTALASEKQSFIEVYWGKKWGVAIMISLKQNVIKGAIIPSHPFEKERSAI